jgi:hypothetical protein
LNCTTGDEHILAAQCVKAEARDVDAGKAFGVLVFFFFFFLRLEDDENNQETLEERNSRGMARIIES